MSGPYGDGPDTRQEEIDEAIRRAEESMEAADYLMQYVPEEVSK